MLVWMKSNAVTPAGVSRVKSSHWQALIFFYNEDSKEILKRTF